MFSHLQHQLMLRRCYHSSFESILLPTPICMYPLSIYSNYVTSLYSVDFPKLIRSKVLHNRSAHRCRSSKRSRQQPYRMGLQNPIRNPMGLARLPHPSTALCPRIPVASSPQGSLRRSRAFSSSSTEKISPYRPKSYASCYYLY